MFRLLHIILTIGALLVCPFRCSGMLTTDASMSKGGLKAASGCRCCRCSQRRASEENSDRVPSRHSNDCGCSNCLCHGAVTTTKVSLPIADLCEFWVDASIACEEAATIELAASLRLDEGISPSAWPDGRTLRHALQSLLN